MCTTRLLFYTNWHPFHLKVNSLPIIIYFALSFSLPISQVEFWYCFGCLIYFLRFTVHAAPKLTFLLVFLKTEMNHSWNANWFALFHLLSCSLALPTNFSSFACFNRHFPLKLHIFWQFTQGLSVFFFKLTFHLLLFISIYLCSILYNKLLYLSLLNLYVCSIFK